MTPVSIALHVLLCAVTTTTTTAADSDLNFELLMSGIGGDEILRHNLTVEGTFPSWLIGTLYQTGGGRFEWPNKIQRNLTNAGDGYAKIDMFQFHSNGRATYTSKFARSAWFNKSVEINDIAPSLSFGVPQPPRTSDKEGLPNVLASNDNLAVNIIAMQDRILMISDQPGSIQFNSSTLEFYKHMSSMPVVGKFTDIPKIPLGMMASFGSAHPLWTGSSLDASGDAYGLLNVQRLSGFDPRREHIRLFKISAEDQKLSNPKNPWLTRRTIVELNMPSGTFAPYMHSFFLVGAPTPTKAVLVQHSMNIAMATLIGGLGLKPISSGFDINCSRPMVFHIIDLNKEEYEQNITVNMKEFTSAAANNSMIVSHTINGYYETTNVLVLDVIGYDFLFFDRFMSSEINNKTARDFGVYSKKRAKTFRFRLDVNANVALTVEELLPNSDWEFPIINEGFKGKPYCHAYGYEFRHEVNMEHQPSNGATGMASMAMIKYHVCQGLDKDTGKRMNQKFVRPYHYFSEPWFVPRPNGTKEDDGVVLTLALDGAVGKGVLYVLNASDLDVMATMPLPVLVNLKTHGRFVWDAPMN